ncbi:uncharacterized protein LOC128279124 [Anopheles cruzii]|uniref:uncharacterized protein LOC128279124 n=1 Tax=Anopheles cruzii TaxID=68878 RepID=UPI0022EC2618|nr:uncharacterized protein LOC128279124 [Anopheles cruzii]
MARALRYALIGAMALAVANVGANFNGVQTSKQAYFFGVKQPTDILCHSQTLLKGSSLPIDVSYTNPPLNIDFITVAADRLSQYGYTAAISSGTVGSTAAVTVKITGKNVLPYAIQVKFYCVP